MSHTKQELRDLAKHWLDVNEKQPMDVQWEAFPVGMVARWVERAEDAEKAVEQLCGAASAVLQDAAEFGAAGSPEKLDWLERSVEARGAADVPADFYKERLA